MMVSFNKVLFGIMTVIFLGCDSGSDAKTIVQARHVLLNIGTIKKGGNAEGTFWITNIGKNNLYISDVESECLCTVTGWKKEPVAPGDSVSIKASYTNNGEIGYFQQKIEVSGNFGNKPLIFLLRGRVDY